MNLIEKTYGNMLRYTFAFINPLKKSVIKTQCEVHKFINIQALEILKNDNFLRAYSFYNHNMSSINVGAVWADQDFKSSTHMYNPYTKKGLYGRKSALDVGLDYYGKSRYYWKKTDKDNSLFYLGAALHILQDMTIPQHANVRLLDSHRQYESFVRRTYQYVDNFKADSNAYILDNYRNYIGFNARTALKIHKRFKNIKEDEGRFYKVAACTLPLAEKTTAGCMVTFYDNVIKKSWS